MVAQLGPVASEILRRIMEFSCVAYGVRRAGLRRTYRTAAPLKFFKKQLKIFIYNRRLK